MKNPIKYLKHLIKDPINTIEEADARKKEIMPWLFGSIGIAVLSGILQGVIDFPLLSIITIIGVLGIILFAFLLTVISSAKKKFAALTCDSCNTMAKFETKEDFLKYVAYTVTDEKVKSTLTHPKSENGVVSLITARGEGTATVSISLKCPNCGKVKSLTYFITPFKCEAVQKKVPVRDVETVVTRLDNAVKSAIADYDDKEKRKKIPFSIHSVHHPNYENRTKPQFGNCYDDYYGATIKYHRTIDELVEGFFVHNELNGTIK